MLVQILIELCAGVFSVLSGGHSHGLAELPYKVFRAAEAGPVADFVHREG